MAIVACRWNTGELEADEAMYQIWKLYLNDFLKIWNQPEIWVPHSSPEKIEETKK